MREEEDSPIAPHEGRYNRQLARDRDLLRRIHSGAPHEVGQAMEELLLYCQTTVAPYIGRHVAGYDNQQEAIQLTCIYVLENVADFRFRGVPLSHWFMRIAGHRIQEQQRTARRDRRRLGNDDELAEEPLDELPCEPSPRKKTVTRRRMAFQSRRYHARIDPEPDPVALPDDLTMLERDRLVKAATRLLPEAEERVLNQMYFCGQTNATAIGHLLGIPAATVRQHHRRALKKLERMPELRKLFDDLSLY